MTTGNQTQLQTAAGQAVAPKAPVQVFRDVLEKMKPQIKLALPKHVDPDRMLRIVLTTIQRTPKLLECTRESLLGCIVQCAQLGLEPDGLLGHAYLIPFNNKRDNRIDCQLIVGYKGLLKLARQSGEIASVSARIVHEKDEFEYEYGLTEKLRHVPYIIRGDADDAGLPIFAYAIFRLKDGSHHFDVMGYQEIERIRNASPSGKSDAWMKHWDEMAKKTVLRRASKMSPASIEDRMSKAIVLDERADAGLPQDIEALEFGEAAPGLSGPAPAAGAGFGPPSGAVSIDATEFVPSTLKQRKEITRLAVAASVNEYDVAQWYGKDAVAELSREMADDAAKRLAEVIEKEKEAAAGVIS